MQRLTFEKWLKKVDEEVQKKTGLSYQDLPDVDYYGLWKTGNSPKQAAKYAIKNAKNY